MTRLAIVTEEAVRRLARRSDVLAAVKAALVALAKGEGSLVPAALARGDGWAFGVKGGVAPGAQILGFKYGSYFPANRGQGLPSHSSTTLLADAETGFLRALVNATWVNGLRTAAADAAAVEALARPDASVLGVLGCGHQAEFEVRAVAEVRRLSEVKLWNRTAAGAEWMRGALQDLGVEVVVTSREAAIAGSDIIVTASASTEPLLWRSEVAAGTHISAMGADQVGKQELDVELVAQAVRFADDPVQAVTIGEFQHAARAGRLAADAITPIGAVIAGYAPGRTSAGQVTVFDSSGVALQDLFVATAILEAAERAGLVDYAEL